MSISYDIDPKQMAISIAKLIKKDKQNERI